MKTTRVILELTAEEMMALRESVEFSKRAVADSQDTPSDVKKMKLAILGAALKKMPRSTPIND